MSDLNQQVMVDEQVDQREWGHPNRRKRGERHWGLPPVDFKVSLDQPEIIAYGAQARVENLGTAQMPRLKFFIPEGRPGTDYIPERGYTGVYNGMEYKNGYAKNVDETVRIIRSFVAIGHGISVEGKFTDEGAISIEINAEDLAKSIVTSVAAMYDGKIDALEKAVSFDDFKRAVESFSADYRAKMTEMSEMKLAFVQLQSEYERLKIQLANHIGS